MKIIELVEKQRNNEMLPKHIRYENEDLYFDGIAYFDKEGNNDLLDILAIHGSSLTHLYDEVEIIEEKTPQGTIKQISKMIASGKIPKDIYDEYLSNCPIGFMNENELVDFLLEREAIDENSLENMIDESLFKDKEIKKLDYCEKNTFSNMKETTYLSCEERRLLDSNFKTIKEKFDELIDEVNKLKNN